MANEVVMPRKVPYSLEAEQSVLGCILLSENVASELCATLSKDDFHSPIHQTIFDAMQTIVSQNQPVDYVTLVNELEKSKKLNDIGGINYITTLTNCVPTAANYEHYTDIVLEDSKLRKLLDMGNQIVAKSFDALPTKEIIDFVEKQLTDITTDQKKGGLVPIMQPVDEATQKFEDIAGNPNAITGLKTGFYGIDRNFNGGLQKGDLVLLAARPGVGKTTLAMNIVTNTAIKENAVVAVFSLEMPKEQLAQRALCSVAKVDMSKALNGKLDQNEWRAIWEARKQLVDSKIYVDDSSLTNTGIILSECRKLKREKGLDLVMIDYLQLMNSSSNTSDANRQQQISEMTRGLKIAAKELDVPILLLSQLSRAPEQRDDHRPMLADLRESGSIEQDADIVLYIYNPDIYKSEDQPKPGVVDIMVAKHRNGETGVVKHKNKKQYSAFISSTADAESGSLEDTMPQTKKDKVAKREEMPVPAEVPPQEATFDDSKLFDDIFK